MTAEEEKQCLVRILPYKAAECVSLKCFVNVLPMNSIERVSFYCCTQM